MPIQHAVWRVGAQPQALSTCTLPSEHLLEEMIIKEPGILSREWMLIGRQEITSHGGRVDLIAIAPDGSLVLIEIKRDRTPRELIAQALDYASWIADLPAEKIAQMFRRFSGGRNLDEAFRERFGAELDEEALNESHQVVVVAAELDSSTERIVGYLNARDININVVLFQVFQLGEVQLLSRAWLIDPAKAQAGTTTGPKTKSTGEKEPWNGEFYVSFGDTTSRSWDDARKFGYISAGGGTWYSQTLHLLSPGDRVWVKIPGVGFVGVGRVLEDVVPVSEFTVETPEGNRPALDVLKHAERYRQTADDPEKTEYFVRVRWLDSLPREQAFSEVGLFGNQNSVCQPTSQKWRHTVERLKEVFPRWDS